MQVKKQAIEEVQTRLTNELNAVQSKIRNNKSAIKQMAEAQAILKRERKVICDLIYSLRTDKKEL